MLYEESFANLIQYSKAMPRFDDEDRPKKENSKAPNAPAKSDGWEVTNKGRTSSRGNRTVRTGDTRTRKGMGFNDFINAMASIKGGFDENNE